MIKVLVVDDSLVVRQHLKHILESDGGIKVAGLASNGKEAVESVLENRPDVVTMDINMPKMNGMEATRLIMETCPVPIVIVSASYDKKDIEKSFQAMEAGAVAILEKPFGQGHPGYREAAEKLVTTVKLMSEVKVIKRWPRSRASFISRPEAPSNIITPSAKRIKAVVIGASTGGPPVIQTILSGLPRNFSFPILIVQHIAHGFLEGLVDWLRHTTSHPVNIAIHGERAVKGHVYFAPNNLHIGIDCNMRITLSTAEPEHGVRPSVSYLFRSAANSLGPSSAGVLLTGMGKDGAEELKLMKDAGAVTFVQDKESAVVYGMPGEALKLEAASLVAAPEKISGALLALSNAVGYESNCKDGSIII